MLNVFTSTESLPKWPYGIRIEILLLGICYKNGFIEMVESLAVTVLLLVGCIRSQRFLVLFMR